MIFRVLFRFDISAWYIKARIEDEIIRAEHYYVDFTLYFYSYFR